MPSDDSDLSWSRRFIYARHWSLRLHHRKVSSGLVPVLMVEDHPDVGLEIVDTRRKHALHNITTEASLEFEGNLTGSKMLSDSDAFDSLVRYDATVRSGGEWLTLT